MKSLIQAVVVAAVLAIPAVSFAQSTQSNQPLTRAEVKAQLIQIEKAGYNPATANDYDYPANIQAAEARVAAQNTAVLLATVAWQTVRRIPALLSSPRSATTCARCTWVINHHAIRQGAGD